MRPVLNFVTYPARLSSVEVLRCRQAQGAGPLSSVGPARAPNRTIDQSINGWGPARQTLSRRALATGVSAIRIPTWLRTVLVHRAVAEANSAAMSWLGLVVLARLAPAIREQTCSRSANLNSRGATGVVLAGALESPKPGLEHLVQVELGLPEQLAFLVVRDVVSAAPSSVAGGAAVVVASGGAIGASGGAMAVMRRPPIILLVLLLRPPEVPTTSMFWSSSTSHGSV